MRVVVTGGREFDDFELVERNMRLFSQMIGSIDKLIHGKARGLDSLVGAFAEANRIPVIACPADWDNVLIAGAVIRYNKQGKPYNVLAGLWRNRDMIKIHKPDYAMVFEGGTGTADMVEQLKKFGIPIWWCF